MANWVSTFFGTVFLVLIRLAQSGGECLPDAIPLEHRRNLTLDSQFAEESTLLNYPRPLGVFTADSAAAKATAAVLEILIQERLGYLLDSHSGTGTTTSDALYALAGCSLNETTDDLICQGTHYHVTLEGWTELYQASWDRLRREYPSVAPRNLGNVGYLGTRSIYVSSEVQQEAHSEGLPLQFYLSYNSSVHNPAKYFDQVDVTNESLTSKLKPCNETRLMSSSSMAAYLTATGDTEGVETVGGSVQGRCFESFFWYAPACRSSTPCLMFFTGGDGWNMEEGMHRSAAWNMPLRIAVAKTDQDYADLPSQISSLFYWWVPDATFLALKPVEIMFPPHDPGAIRRGDLRNAAKQISVDKYISHDLEQLAPRVAQLVQAFQMDLEMVNSILKDQLSTGEAFSLVACRWLQSTQTWQSWLPKASECLPRFGLYDRQSGRFLQDPSDSANFECRACQPGSYSSSFGDPDGHIFICKPCPQGTAQKLQGSLTCDLCPEGKYQDQTGSTSCKRCGIGSYQNAKGQRACKDCQRGTSSVGFASQSISDCGCKKGTMNVGQDNIRCVTCNEGINCPLGSSLDALRTGTSPWGEEFLPTIRRGYHSSVDEPLMTSKCRKQWHCPGGVPGQCAGGRTQTACAQCPAGQAWLGTGCNDCNGLVLGAWVVGIVLVLVMIACSYYLVSNHISAQASLSESVSMILITVLNAAQCLGIISLIDVTWPPAVEIVFSTSQFFILDFDLFGLRCLVGAETLNNYLFTAALVPFAQLWLLLCCTGSSFLPKAWQWSWNRATSTMGSLLLCAFTTTSVVALSPFLCYLHPNGTRSNLKYPEVLCEGPSAMQTVGLVLLTLYVAGFWVVCAYGACCLPSWMMKRRREMVLSFRFLIFRVRVDNWAFEIFWMLRGPSLALIVLLLADQTSVQIYAVCLGFAAFLLMQTYAWPWKVPLMNLFDGLMSLFLLSLMVVAPSEARQHGENVSAVIMAIFAAAMGFLVTLILFVVVNRRVLNDQNVFFNLGHLEVPRELRDKMQFFSQNLQTVQDSQIERILGQMSVHDLRLISASLDLLVAEIIPAHLDPPANAAGSNRRISVQLLNRSQTLSAAFSEHGSTSPPEDPNHFANLQVAAMMHSAPPEGLSAHHEFIVEQPVEDEKKQSPEDPEDCEDVLSASTSGKARQLVSIQC